MKNNGFSLIELLVTLSLVGIILSIGMPSMQNFIKSERLDTQVTTLHSFVGLARSEAVKRGDAVSLCASSDQASCTGTWTQGWIVFEDLNGDGDVDTDDTLLKVQQSLPSGTVTFSSNNPIIFSSRGFTSGSNNTFTICDEDANATLAKGIIVMSTGSTRRTADRVGTDNTHEDHAGAALTCS